MDIFPDLFRGSSLHKIFTEEKEVSTAGIDQWNDFSAAFCCAAEYDQQLCFRGIFLYRVLAQSWLLAILSGSRFPGNIV
mgnify:CR=1